MHTKEPINRSLIVLCFCIMIIPFSSASCIFSKPIEAVDLDIGNMLSWSTSEEIANQFFVVQKSVDGEDYQTIGQVQGAGNSSDEQHYRFLDIAIGEQRIFYRIQHIDFSGTTSDTHTLVLNRAQENNFLITAMSRTATDRFFTLTMRSSIEAYAKYELLDKSSRVQEEGKASIVNGVNMISFDLQKLPLGRYRLLIKMGEEKEEVVIRKVDPSQVPLISYMVKEE